MWYLLAILIAVVSVTNVNGSCATCNSHGFACINSNQFRLCLAGDKMDETINTCPPGQICTDLGVVCADSTSTSPLGCTDQCSICEAGKSFACTSRTTWALCSAGVLTSITGTCGADLYCDTDTANVCIDKCLISGGYKCDKPATTTPPTTSSPPTSSPPTSSPSTSSPPTSSPPVQTPDQVCAANNSVGRFPYTSDNCLNYVYCRYLGSSLIGIASTCPTGQYFNKNIQDCQSVKPSWCT